MRLDLEYELRDVAAATHMTPRRLRGWLERGHPIAEILNKPRGGKGAGHRLKYSIEDVLRLAIISELKRCFGLHFRPGFFTKWLWKMPARLLLEDRLIFFRSGDKIKFGVDIDEHKDLSSWGVIEMAAIYDDVWRQLARPE